MTRILVAGSINMDVVAQVQEQPKPGQTIFGSNLQFIPGGKGANQAVAAGRLSEHVSLVGKLGEDAFGHSLRGFLSGERLNLDHLSVTSTAATGTALISVDAHSENMIIVIPGSNGEMNPADVAGIPLQAGDIVVSVFEIPQETIKALFARAKQAGATTILSPAPAVPFIAGLLDLCDFILLNETEVAFFAGQTAIENVDVIQGYVKQFRVSSQQTIIVTLGSKGALAVAGDTVIQTGGHTVKAVDTTGAGDCFVGAFAVAMSEGKTLADAIRFANAAAALSVQKVGASSSMPSREQVEAFLTS